MRAPIELKGIRTNNLKNINVELQKNEINLIVGPSGSGKSSLAYDTIGQIGEREFQSIAADDVNEASYSVSSYQNMVAAVSLSQENPNNNSRSTIGTRFGINSLVASIFAMNLGLAPSQFSLNRDSNQCPNCQGLGNVKQLDELKIIKPNTPLNQNPFNCWNKHIDFYKDILNRYCQEVGIDPNKTISQLTKQEKQLIFYGSSSNKFSIRYKRQGGTSTRTTQYFGPLTNKPMMINYRPADQFKSDEECPECNGQKYSNDIEKLTVAGISIGKFMTTPFRDLAPLIEKLKQNAPNEGAESELKRIEAFITEAIALKLGHLFFHRSIPTLSGGEFQRLRMVQLFNSQLEGLLVILDEPLTSLSPEEKSELAQRILKLAKLHTLVIVDHETFFQEHAKNIIALGPGSGFNGGMLVNPSQYFQQQNRVAPFTSPPLGEPIQVGLTKAIHGYQGIDINIAAGSANLVIGASGVGKTTLLKEYLPRYFSNYEYIDQKPLGHNSNSNVATILNIATLISQDFAKYFHLDTKEFSNLTGNPGACKICGGSGFVKSGTSDNQYICRDCNGTGFRKELSEKKIGGLSIIDLWRLTIDQAISYFDDNSSSFPQHSKILNALNNANNLLLGHLFVGQPSSSISGGENVRLKLIKQNKSGSKQGSTVLGIDEPFKGLSRTEIDVIARHINKMAESGRVTVIVVDHSEFARNYFKKQITLANNAGWLKGHSQR